MLKKLAAKMEGLAAKMDGGGGGGSLIGKQLAVGGQMVKVDKLLGEGGFATIYRCVDVDTGVTYALKHFILTAYPDAEYDAQKEVAVMQALHACPAAVRLHAAAPVGAPGGEPTAACALMEYCPGTLVGHLAARGGVLTDSEVVEVLLAVAVAVREMHALDPPLAHRDLKAENVLQAADGRWVLCDFGSVSTQHGVLAGSREIALEEEVVRRYTTPAYRAPELFDLYAREYLGPQVDIWALGVLLYLLAFGRLPFEGEAKLQVLNGRYSMPDGRSPVLRSLVTDMLRVSPRERPTIVQVVARLAALAPPELLQQLQVEGRAVSPAATPAAAAAASILASHQRFPSQGWADFAAESSPVAGGSRAGSRAGSGSWATFSPKKLGVGEEEGGLLAAEDQDRPSASAGSFWSSFDEMAPAEAQAPPPLQPTAPPSQQQQQQQQQPVQQQQQQQQQSRQQAVSAASTAASAAAPAPASTPPPAKAAAAAPPVDVSPLSAGLSRMSHVSRVGEASVAKPPAPASTLPGRGNSGMAAGLQPGTAATPAPSAAAAAMGSAREAQGLRQHCLVLEQLLESRNEEVQRLQRQVEQQGAEIRQLRQQLAAAQQGGAQQAAAAASAPAVAAGSVATPASSRMGQDLSLQVPGSSSTPQGGGSWVSFSATGGQGDAPTPTLLQPAAGGSFKGSSRLSASGGAAPAAAGNVAAAGATPASSTVQLEQQLRYKLDLSMRTDNLGRAMSLEAPPPLPMRSSSSGNGSSAATAAQPVQSFPVALTPTPPALVSEGSRSAPASAKPSPMHQGSSGQLSALGSGRSGSPMKPRPVGGLALDTTGSPTKGHKRNLTAPNAFFQDLNPIH